MVGRRKRLGKAARVHFAEPPWDEEHPRWRELDEELAVDHIARRVVAAMKTLDLTPLYESYSGRGSRPTQPDLMLRIVLIEIRLGRIRPSNWHRDARENDPLKWAGMGIRPSRTAWYDFHDRVAPLLADWNAQVVEFAIEQNVTSGKRASLDGSTFAANASRYRLVNEATLAKRIGLLRDAMSRDDVDKPVKNAPAWMVTTPWTRQSQLLRFERAQERLTELHAINQRQDPSRRRPRENIVISTSDPEAALGRDKFKVFRPLYNMQLMYDLDSLLFLHYDVLSQATDAGTLKPMLNKVTSLKGIALGTLLADAGYVTASNLALCELAGVTLYGPWQENDFSKKKKSTNSNSPKRIGKNQFTWLTDAKVYVCPQGHRLKWIGKQKRRQADGEINIMHRYRCNPDHCCACPSSKQCTTNPKRGRSVKRSEHEELVEIHRQRMLTDEAKRLYKKRSQTVELGYADVKEHRAIRRFPRRGRIHAKTHVGLAVLINNLLIVHRATRNSKQQPQEALNCETQTT